MKTVQLSFIDETDESQVNEIILEALGKVSNLEKKNTPNDLFNSIRQWATEKGIYAKGDAKTQTLKLGEEFGELSKAIINEDQAEIEDAIGDCVVVLTSIAHMKNTSIEKCIEGAYQVIANRKGKMQNGSFIKES